MSNVVYLDEERAKREFAGFNLVDKILKVIYSLEPIQTENRGYQCPGQRDKVVTLAVGRVLSKIFRN
jgi:hypothetical protein